MNKDVNLSYWEIKSYLRTYDFIVIGSGIVGLSSAISIKHKHPLASVLVVEKGILPEGASFKNAGFACFGSCGELLDDLKKMPENTVWETVQMRWKGLQMLRKRLGDKNLAYEPLGGFELFKDKKEFDDCRQHIEPLNTQIHFITGKKNCFATTSKQKSNFRGVEGLILNQHEGQIDTGIAMSHLLALARKKGIVILNNINISELNDTGSLVHLKCNFAELKAKKVIVATNGFTNRLTKIKDLNPARAQVLITEPIKGLKIKGAFHYQSGYYYFRNIDNRILLGGGRNLDFEGETTDEHSLNATIHKQLDTLLKEMILPGHNFKIEHRWSGIMAVGNEKKPIIKHLSKNVVAAVRMGGMGVAIGTWVGNEVAELLK